MGEAEVADTVEEELDLLGAALHAHLEALRSSGTGGLPRCDEATLEGRRERYRALARSHSVTSEGAHEEARKGEGPAAALPETPPPRAASAVGGQFDSRTEPALDTRTDRAPSDAPASSGVAVSGSALGSLGMPATGAPATRLEDDAHTRLVLLEREVSECTRCDLHRGRTNTVFARGTGQSGLCFIGEGPGADEDIQGYPFVGAAGQLLDKMIAAMGFTRDEVYVCNIVKCRPPKNRKPEPAEMAACRGYLERQLELIEPKVIVALGASAIHGLLGVNIGIMRLRGQWRVYRGKIPVMPTFHPAYLLRQPSAKRQVWDDLKLVLDHLGRAAPSSG